MNARSKRLVCLRPSGIEVMSVSAVCFNLIAPYVSTLPAFRCRLGVPSYGLRSGDDRELWLVYAEPQEYQAHKSPTPPDLFDLSERIGDVEGLPGMARLAGPPPDTPLLLVILLGFEGGRARHITTTLEPEPTIVPVVGVPGMHAEYATQAVECNREFLKNTDALTHMRWVDAVCPFSVRDLLGDIATEHSESYMYVAPIGTKPHALGALLYVLSFPTDCEIIYDHPTPRRGGTSGIGKIHLYRLD